MSDRTMAEVLAEHYESGTEFAGIGGSWIAGCICAWNSNDQQTYGMAKVAHARHVSEHLSAAGFGLVADAVVIHVAHDTEAHARSFNEGYETAIAQGLADDPTLAHDWLDAKLADAQGEALEEAADEWEAMVRREKPPIRGYLWLRARAAELRKP